MARHNWIKNLKDKMETYSNNECSPLFALNLISLLKCKTFLAQPEGTGLKEGHFNEPQYNICGTKYGNITAKVSQHFPKDMVQ